MPRPKRNTESRSAATETTKHHDQIQELTQALQRERADAENIRRRHQEEITSLNNRAKTSIIRGLLPVIDNFERALKHVPKELNGNDYIKGVQAIVKQFEGTLTSMGVEHIKTIGQHFDPHLHEAVSMEDGDGKHEIITEELQAGYRIGKDVIRHSMVRVKRQK